MAHRIMGQSLVSTGDIAQGRAHLDQAIALYDPAEHRPLATRFSADAKVVVLCFRSLACWMLGYPEAALADAERALNYARKIGQAATLLLALFVTSMTFAYCGGYATAKAETDELAALAGEKGTLFWKALGMLQQGSLFVELGKASDAVQIIMAGITACQSMGTTAFEPRTLSFLASAHAELGDLDDARRCVGEAMTAADTTKERWWDAEVNRIAGEIAIESPEPDTSKAQEYFQRALEVARQQQAKSWELRAAMSMARLWRDQGRPQQARELLAPVYGWFTEGFDTRDLKEAKALLEELAS